MGDKLLNNIFDEYKLNKKEKKEILNYIYDIYKHPEFQKRLTDEFMHHDKITLGQHIIEDTIVTYKLIHKKRKKCDLKVALYISMFHDLYTSPWQNNSSNDTAFFHKHGFRHPIEAVINSLTWFPDIFDREDADRIIDGIIHHMYPLPVCVFKKNKENKLELQNYDLISDIDDTYIELIEKSSSRFSIFGVSFSRSKYKEGKIMSKADKKVSINNFRHTPIKSKMALLTGKNKHIKWKIIKLREVKISFFSLLLFNNGVIMFND